MPSSPHRPLLAGALLAIACGSPEPPPAPIIHPGYNVILIVADTLRADHLGSSGYERDTSPFLDELARWNVHFTNARSQASCTSPSVNSLLTSRNVVHFQDPELWPRIPEGFPTLASILGEHGYSTAAFSASPIVRRTPTKHNPHGGFGHGFDTFDEYCLWYPSTCVTTRALRHLAPLVEDYVEKARVLNEWTALADTEKDPERRQALEAEAPPPPRPFFAYLHYMDPHDPYIALPEHRGLFAAPYDGEHTFIAAGDPNPIDTLIQDGREDTLGEADFQHLIDLYDEEIRSLDLGLERLFTALDAWGILGRTLFVLSADHGEAFFEHGRIKHCYTVYDEEVRVPLVLGLPRVARPLRSAAPAANLDIVPTLLDYLGLDASPYGLEGRSLRPVIEAEVPPRRYAFSSQASWRSVADERYKLVVHLGEKSSALYDVVSDPRETIDLTDQNLDTYHRLARELKAWTDSVEAGLDDAQRVEQARQIEEKLRAVGYLGGG